MEATGWFKKSNRRKDWDYIVWNLNPKVEAWILVWYASLLPKSHLKIWRCTICWNGLKIRKCAKDTNLSGDCRLPFSLSSEEVELCDSGTDGAALNKTCSFCVRYCWGVCLAILAQWSSSLCRRGRFAYNKVKKWSVKFLYKTTFGHVQKWF